MVKLGYADAPAMLVTSRGATPGGRVQMQPHDTARIPLYASNGSIWAYATVDAADADFLSQWRWSISTKPGGYAYRTQRIDGKLCSISMHRFILGLLPGDPRQGDHIDRNHLNNQRSNLRIVPRGANAQNLSPRKGATSRFRGVSWSKSERKWVVQMRINGKFTCLGRFSDEEQAAEFAKEARRKHMPYAMD